MITPIFESLVVKQNKNAFNKILSSLKQIKTTGMRNENVSNTYILFFGEEYYNIKASIRYDYIIKDVIMYEDNDKVYFLAKVVLSPNRFSIQDGYIYRVPDPTKYVYEYILKKVTTSPKDGFYYDKKLVDAFKKDGMNIDYSMSSDETSKEVLASKPYKKLKALSDEIMSTDINTILHPKALTKLKLRKEIMPLMWYDKEEQVIVYPFQPKEQGSGINAVKYRNSSLLRSFLSHDNYLNRIQRVIIYSPFTEWVLPDVDSINIDGFNKTETEQNISFTHRTK